MENFKSFLVFLAILPYITAKSLLGGFMISFPFMFIFVGAPWFPLLVGFCIFFGDSCKDFDVEKSKAFEAYADLLLSGGFMILFASPLFLSFIIPYQLCLYLEFTEEKSLGIAVFSYLPVLTLIIVIVSYFLNKFS